MFYLLRGYRFHIQDNTRKKSHSDYRLSNDLFICTKKKKLIQISSSKFKPSIYKFLRCRFHGEWLKDKLLTIKFNADVNLLIIKHTTRSRKTASTSVRCFLGVASAYSLLPHIKAVSPKTRDTCFVPTLKELQSLIHAFIQAKRSPR